MTKPRFDIPARAGNVPPARARVPLVIMDMREPAAANLVKAPAADPRIPSGRVFFEEPGLPVVVRWVDFQPMLSPQLEHPDRLRDSHRLPCRLQVYEALAPQPAAPLAAARFQPLDKECEEDLGLDRILPPRRKARAAGDAEVEPFDRFFRLRVINDPTRELEAAPSGRRRAVPERFLANAWEFRFSREEAVYDMSQVPSVLSRAAQAIRRLLGSRRREFQKWRALLDGKPLEDQLFAVRPPKGSLGEAEVRKWAEATLTRAGFNTGPMLKEWEIFWRRKGV